MQGSKVQCTTMVFCLWLYILIKVHGFNCNTGNRPLWESPTYRCTFYFNWNCSLSEGENIILKTWIKEDKGAFANCTRMSNFTITNDFEGRLERYNENGFILKGLTTKDAGYYILAVVFTDNDSSLQRESISSIYVPSMPSCDDYMESNTSHLTGGNDSSHASPCDVGHMPVLTNGLLVALGIVITVLLSTNIYLCKKYKYSQIYLRSAHNDREDLNPLPSSPGSPV